jgi:tRNA(Ile)-lysidine synthase
VRPLLRATRADTRAYCSAHRLEWREDPSNADRRFARSRVRHDLLEALRSIAPAAERTVAETSLLLRDEAEVLERATEEVLEGLGGGPAVQLAELRAQPPALARLVLRDLAEAAAGGRRRLSREEADAVLALPDRGGTRALDLGGGVRAVAEYGTLRFTAEPNAEPPEPVELPIPGSARFGEWELEVRSGAPGDVSVSSAALGRTVIVRAWREGDRMRPVGLGGSKSLQDLFTDRKVPRALRRRLPVVEAGGEVVWVAGVALDERFAVPEGSERAVWLSARHARGSVRG